MQGVLLPRGHSEQMGPCPDCDGTGHTETEPELSITRKATNKSYPNCSKVLVDVLEGKTVLAIKTWDYLKPLTTSGAGSFDTHEFNEPAEVGAETEAFHMGSMATGNSMSEASTPYVFPFTTTIVGSSYRNCKQQSALRNKNSGNRVLIIPEPANPQDPHAMAVVAAKGISQGQFVWIHVGYVPRTEAKQLANIWPRYRGRLLVGEGRLVGHPRDDKNPKIVIEASFRNYFPD